jgi:amphi-Trp domain-containing protein
MSSDAKKSVELKERLELDQAIELIEDIVAKLKKGAVTLEQGDETLTIHPEESVKLGVKAKHKGEKQSLQFELKWRRTPAEVESEPESEPESAPEQERDEAADK